MSVDHYENFPVASLLLPASLRPAVDAIYRWARCADDIADEGEFAPQDRLVRLQAMDQDLDRIGAGSSALEPITAELAPHIGRHALPIQAFHDLLSAFSQDVGTARYADFAGLSDYCRRSANPIGRLMLHLYRAAQLAHLDHSDAICTGLQLTNFWQDVAIDWHKARVYLPQDDCARFGIADRDIARFCAGDSINPAWRELMQFELDRARALLKSGAPLARALPGRIGLELALVIQGGLRILERIEAVEGDVFRHRPTLRARDWSLMLLRAVHSKVAP